jgi:uncharacterized protein (TIGR03492 family)
MNSPKALTVIVLSNGHGEDAIGVALGRALKGLGLEVKALPLVGRGTAYEQAGFEVLGPRHVLPSGGFVYADLRALWSDLRGGWLASTAAQWLALRQARPLSQVTLAVGDWYALAVASLLGSRPLFQYQPAVSVRAWQRQGLPWARPFGPLERFLMKRAHAVYSREAEAAAWLQQHGIRRAYYLGNPMLDAVEGAAPLPVPPPYLLLLPGSRSDAYFSLPLMMEACRHLRSTGLTPVVAWAGLPLADLEIPGWEQVPGAASAGVVASFRHPDGTGVYLTVGAFKTALQGSRLALSTSGTAAEQAAGFGVPLVGFPTEGPQYTPDFARRQQRLLGDALMLTEAEPRSIARAACELLEPGAYARAQQSGRAAMGEPGAARRIAEDIGRALSSLS